jgi:hypothetical protein
MPPWAPLATVVLMVFCFSLPVQLAGDERLAPGPTGPGPADAGPADADLGAVDA